MVTAQLTLVGANGDSIALGTDYQTDYMLGTNVSGLGLTTANVDIAEGAGDGGVWRRTRRNPRVIDLPILVFGDNRTDIQAKLRRLAKILSDRLGPTRIKVEFQDETATVYTYGHLIDGGDVTYGSDANQQFCRWVVSLRCPDPYWTSEDVVSFKVQQNADTDGLLPYLGELRLTDGQSLGSTTVSNPGEVEAWPVWQITGPCDAFTVSLNGTGFTYSAAIASGAVVIVNTKDGTVESSAGANLYANLAAAPKLFSLPSGTSTVTVTATNPTSATLIQCYFNPRHELVY
jgi:hypothetical protein